MLKYFNRTIILDKTNEYNTMQQLQADTEITQVIHKSWVEKLCSQVAMITLFYYFCPLIVI